MSKDDRYEHLGDELDDETDTADETPTADSTDEQATDQQDESGIESEVGAATPDALGATAESDAPPVDRGTDVDPAGPTETETETTTIPIGVQFTVADTDWEKTTHIDADAVPEAVASRLADAQRHADADGAASRRGLGDRTRALMAVGAVAGAAGVAAALRRRQSDE